ncbi:MAG: MgtC/SapB family protein [Clostridiales bacterium]|nr:MgtC/SapB family protein [Clostridiales bacterium]
MDISNQQILIRLLASVAVGLMYGMERKRRHKPVGKRTHVLICLCCAVLTIISAYGFKEFTSDGVPSDPARLMVGILTGIGFIGGGIIWKSSGGMVQGITTAASVLLLAALGIAIGLGLYFLAGAAAFIGLITLEGNSWADSLRRHTDNETEEDILERAEE